MSNGNTSRLARHAKAALQWLDYLAHKPTLWAMTERPKPERMRLTVAERIRFKWWLRWKYGPECAYCHRAYDWRYGLTIDHIQPVSKGGALRDIQNMALACRACNEAKGDTWEDLKV